jgi:elongation factor P
MATTNDAKKGMRVKLDGDPYVITDVGKRSLSGRGGGSLVDLKMRNLRTKQFLSKTFKAGERLELPDFEIRNAQYLYAEGEDLHHFMDLGNYEQFALPAEMIEDELGFLLPEAQVRALVFEEQCIGVELDNTVELEVVECDPGVKGDTVTNVTKSAKLETGLELQVPLFIERGQRIVVDTRDRRYLKRA